MKTTIIFFCFFILLGSGTVAAQAIDKEKEKRERQEELQRKTLILVDEILAGASGLKLPGNRSYVLITSADLLWNYDEKRARNVFWEAVSALNSGSANGPRTKGSAKEQDQNAYFANYQLRRALLQTVARRDPQLALDLLVATRQSPPEQLNANFRLPDERELEQQIAAEAAARDPKRALQLARESLARGFSFELLSLLYRLNERDAEAGSKFASDIIDKLRTTDLGTEYYAAPLAIELILFSRTAKDVVSDSNTLAVPYRQVVLDEQQRRDLVEMITNDAMRASFDGFRRYSMVEIMPEIEQFFPGRVRPLQRKIADLKATIPRSELAWNEHNSLVRGGNPQEMLAAAANADSEQRESLEREAVLAAVFSRKVDAFREYINKQIDSDSRRKFLIDELDAEEVDYAGTKGNIAELRKLLPQIRRKEERGRAMAQLAVLLNEKGEHDEALALLDEAQSLIKTDLRSEKQTNALLGLVLGYALVAPERAFAILERTIDRSNEEIARLLILDKLVKTGVVKKGEIVLQQGAVVPLDFALFKYGKGIAALASADFARTRGLADRFQRNELRLMARLLLAQALLKKTVAD